MGQPFPLPEKIPQPQCDEDRKIFEACGFTIDNITDKYVNYTMPEGWKFVDRTRRLNFPIYFFVDPDGMRRFCVSGVWQGLYDDKFTLYDNELSFIVCKSLEVSIEPEI